MPIEDYPIVGSFNNQRVSPLDSERSVNCFEYIDPLGKKPKALLGTSGLINTNVTFTGSTSTSSFRGEFVFDGYRYDVVGNRVYRTDSSGVITVLKEINTSVGYIGITANTFQVIFVDGQDGWIWDTIAETFNQITDTNFPDSPIDVTYLDGFFVVANGGTNDFYLSLFNQGMVWGGGATPVQFTASVSPSNLLTLTGTTNANFQTGTPVQVSNSGGALPTTTPQIVSGTVYYAIAVSSITTNPGTIKLATSYENAIAGTAIVINSGGSGTNTIFSTGQLQKGSITANPGTIVACRTLHRRLYLFSQNFTEIWENAGIGTNLPFRRNNSLLMQYGLAAIGSLSISFDIMVFLANDKDGQGSVMMVIGANPIPISTRALDFVLAQYASSQQISDCSGFLIKENGIIFYRMNFTAANHTYVYNVSHSNPSEDATKYWHEEEVLNGDRHPAQTHAYFNGKNYVGSYKSPTLYILDSNTYKNDEEVIRRMRIAAPIVPPGYQRQRIDRFQIDFLQGSIALLDPTQKEQSLLTEDNNELLTESGETLLLEQEITVANPIIPTAFLSISKDGGQTYGYQLTESLGAPGNRIARTVFRKLGTTVRGQAFVPKLEFYDPVPFAVLGAAWFYEVLPE